MYFCDGKIWNYTAYLIEASRKIVVTVVIIMIVAVGLVQPHVRSLVPFSKKLAVYRDVLPFRAIVRIDFRGWPSFRKGKDSSCPSQVGARSFARCTARARRRMTVHTSREFHLPPVSVATLAKLEEEKVVEAEEKEDRGEGDKWRLRGAMYT